MFERYTEIARRVIFFARYEASVFGSPYIESDHLLLGLLREDGDLRGRLGFFGADSFRKQVEANSPVREKISTSVDLPLSQECRRVLSYGAEEAEAMHQNFIGAGHLILGLLRIDTSAAATFLKQNGIQLESYRGIVTNEPPGFSEPAPAPQAMAAEPREPRPPEAATLSAPIGALARLIDLPVSHLEPDQRLKRKPWSRREAMGHLINLAAVHHQWLARALTEPKVTAAGYPGDEWVAVQQYADYPWHDLVDLWIALNLLLLHELALTPEEKLTIPCRIGIDGPRTLLDVVRRYVSDSEDLVGQILAKLD